ncbi:hypothetical protein G4G28_13855 [Massilia sp. Dwa41.01b]|uniref:glycoside hydrolase family 75 protein n=1 Tax=unclassified Massilia TaxID=2609279 RepID=UPI00160156BD|nr:MULTISPECIES: glycoside hydrolase family 75 protein [unclassified Massilia]QNA89278.1 hypothetical protein G4G28_13855 [Massilia sp. Dwa41.01b]QNB00180.1 hypothetical protein G4G31_17425 [Massilia sp. Se16.2.3]
MRTKPILAAAILAPLSSLVLAQTCPTGIANGDPWTHNNAVLFKRAPYNVDADGAPNSYLVDGKGLSFTCDGVVAFENGKRVTSKTDKKHWQAKCQAAWKKARASGDYGGVRIFGFETGPHNVPLIQKAGDPLPGKAYISATSIGIPGQPAGTQRRYVDATRIPYIVLPQDFIEQHAIKPGTLAVVYRPATGRHAFAVYADGGGLGEGSIKLHQDLGSDPIVMRDGVARAKARIEDPVLTAVFPAAVSRREADAAAWHERIQKEGAAALDAFGGIAQLQACAK